MPQVVSADVVFPDDAGMTPAISLLEIPSFAFQSNGQANKRPWTLEIQSCTHLPLPKCVLHTDVGLAGGGGAGVIYQKGQPLRRVPEAPTHDE